MPDLNMRILLQAQDLASSVVKNLSGVLSGTVSPMQAITTAGLVLGGAIVGVGVASVNAAANFQASQDKVQALAGLSKSADRQHELVDLANGNRHRPDAANALARPLSRGISGLPLAKRRLIFCGSPQRVPLSA